jgi:thiamine-monophosphate kinase
MTGEFDFIKRIRKHSAFPLVRTDAFVLGVGDDAAIVRKDSKRDLVITTDLLIEDIDFRREWTNARLLGRKSLAVSLSDVAAMGARPCWAMLSIGVSRDVWQTKFLDEFYKGWFALAKEIDVTLIGGDISRTPDKIVIDSIVAGEAKRGKAVLRSGAEVGDFVFVTGTLGGAAAGLMLLERGERLKMKRGWTNANEAEKLLLRQLRPNAQIEIGIKLGENNLATSMIDLSDGLSSDLAHICCESNVGAIIEASQIPIEPAIVSHFEDKEERLNLALHGGEDFELLFTVAPRNVSKLMKKLEGHQIKHIGVVTDKPTQMFINIKNRKRRLKPEGFIHFS